MTQRFIFRIAAGCGTALLIILSPMSVRAATLSDMFPPGVSACYETYYGRKIPIRKQVDRLRLFTTSDNTSADKASEVIIFEMDVSLKQGILKRVLGVNKRLKTVGLICFRQNDDSWNCQEHTCNGRAINLRVFRSNQLLLDLSVRRDGTMQRGSLTLNSACGSEDVERQSQLVLTDQVFWLKRASVACR